MKESEDALKYSNKSQRNQTKINDRGYDAAQAKQGSQFLQRDM